MRAAIAVGAMLITAALMVPPRSVAAQTQGGGNVPTVTRLVKIFLDKEQALGTAIRAGDATALEGLLTDDFEVREGAQPGTPIPRADWVRNVIRAHDAGGSITGIAVHDFGTVAIASFSQSTANTSVLIVDVWRQAASDWKLAVRYTSNSRPAPSGSSARPRPVEIPKKY